MTSPKTTTQYTPPEFILDRYAEVLVNFALHSGKGLRSGEVVQIAVPDVAKPLARALYKAVILAGGHPLLRILPTEFDKVFYELANEEQLTFFPKTFLKTKAALLDHSISIIADVDPEELKGVDTSKIMTHRAAQYPYREWLFAKEHKGTFSWTAGLWGTPAKAAVVGLSYKEYWQQIIKACYLDFEDPVSEWRKLEQKQRKIKNWLNDLNIEFVHITGPDADLKIKIGANRAWKTGSGSNIPSYEHFTSPDWRGTEGWIAFNQPLYRYGNVIDGIRLEFKKGRISKATAKKGQVVLDSMLTSKDADKLGEFSLTDKRFSRITHPMAETLYDENMGGPHGNTHIAVGMAYKDCFKGDASSLKAKDWQKLGYNNSSVHTDIISTAERTVTAHLPDGTQKVIYTNGSFTLE